MLVPEPTFTFAELYHWTVTEAVPVTPIDRMENDPELISDGLLVGCEVIPAGMQTLTAMSELLNAD